MSSIDTSGIDPTKPVQGNPLTANVRANTAAIKTQLENAGVDIDTINTFLAGIDSDSTNDQTKSEIDALILKGLANGYATLDAGAKIPTAQLPALALTDVFTVTSEIEQLALTAQEGDIAIRSDENKTYAHNGGVAGTMADWTLLATPTDVVLSVSGNTGVVTAAQLKTAYEALADTNAYTDSEKTFLASLDTAIDSAATATAITISSSENVTFNGDVSLADSKRIYWGDGAADYYAYHDGVSSYLTNQTGQLNIWNRSNSGLISISTDDSGGTIKPGVVIGGATPNVRLHYGGNEVMSTVSNGIRLADNKFLYIGNSNDLYIYHDATNSRVYNNTGNLIFRELVASGLITFYTQNSSAALRECLTIGGAIPAVKLFYDNVEVMSTVSGGVSISGNLINLNHTGYNPNNNVASALQIGGSFGGGITLKDGPGYCSIYAQDAGTALIFGIGSSAGTVPVFRLDNSTVSGNTRMFIYDVDNATLERVTVGAADSGGAGFKVLRIPN